ncbi:hypothetical protein ACFWNN_00075 [Lentzea sp. NPDC058450]|uniref:hypothetical protein n=1 Tax=Lentzea sp. NPDC058450 TaxID=3346505 RepID=UPI00365E3E68
MSDAAAHYAALLAEEVLPSQAFCLQRSGESVLREGAESAAERACVATGVEDRAVSPRRQAAR